jgi:hypothetical protein
VVKVGRVSRYFGAVSADDEQRIHPGVTRNIMKQFQRSLISPMEVVNPEQQGAHMSQAFKRLDYALEQS